MVVVYLFVLARNASQNTYITSAATKKYSHSSKMKDAQPWILTTSMQNVVYKEPTNELVSIKVVKVSKLSVSDLHLFCVAHNISGYKNKKRSHALLLIVLHTQAMVVENIMYPLLPASDDDDNCGSGIDMSNKNGHAATKIFVNAAIDDEESVVVEKGKDPQYEQGKEQITASINNKKSIKSKRSKGSPLASIIKSGIYFRVINVFFHEIHYSKVVKLGSAPSISKLDHQLFLYKNVNDSLLETYSDGTNTDINWLAFNIQYFDDVGKLCDAA